MGLWVFFQARVEEMISDPRENRVGIDYFVLSQRARATLYHRH